MSTSSELNTDISRDITHGVSTTSASTKSCENTTLLSKGLGRILNNTSTDDTLKPHDGGVTRYVYDISTRTHMLYRSDPITYQKTIGDSSRTARETTINDPYYDVFGSRKETLTSTRHSWHEILPVHRTDITTNENQRRKIPVETLIDFRSPVEHSKEFEHYGSFRNDRHVSETRSRSVEPQFVAHPAQAGHTVSTGNILPDINERFGRKTFNGAVDVRKSPVFSLGGRENSQGPPLYTSSTSGSFLERERAVKPHVPDYKNDGRAPLPSYSAVVRARSREPNDSERSVDTGELEMRRREEMSNEYFVKAKSDAGQIPYRDSRSQRQANTTSFIRQYDQPPFEHTDRNAQIISRANPTLTQMNEKLQAETSYSNSPNSATDYGNDWGDKTPVIHGTNEDQPLPQFPLRQNRHYPGEVEMEPTQGKLASLPLPPYAYRPSLPPPQPSPEQILRGDVECGGGETRLLKDAQAPKAKTKKMLISTASTTHHRPRHIRFLKWTPANCSNPRDCCLNCLFFFIAPLVVLFIILAIIITLVIG